MNKAEYWEYLKSEWWQSRRLVALRKANLSCEICSEELYLEVHHKNYDNLWHEEDEDLIVLCEICHTKFNAGGFDGSNMKIKYKLGLPITEHEKRTERTFRRAQQKFGALSLKQCVDMAAGMFVICPNIHR